MTPRKTRYTLREIAALVGKREGRYVSPAEMVRRFFPEAEDFDDTHDFGSAIVGFRVPGKGKEKT